MNSNNDTSCSLEHLNITVSNPDHAAKLLCELFNWEIRWSGAAIDNGRTVHVGKPGNGSSYLALYTHTDVVPTPTRGANQVANLNHIGILAANLNDVEKRLNKRGISIFNYANYDPGKRFYFYMDDHIEVEVISYD